MKLSHLLVLLMAALLTSACATTELASGPEPSDEFALTKAYVNAVNREAQKYMMRVYWINFPSEEALRAQQEEAKGG